MKMNMPDKITCDECIKPRMLEITALDYFQYMWILKPVIKRDQLINVNDWIKRYNNRLDEKIAYLMVTNLLNRYKYILENIDLSTSNYCRYLDQNNFTFWLGYNPDDNKQWLTVLIYV